MDIKQFKSNKKEAFIEKHKPKEQGLAGMAYQLPSPNDNFKQGGQFLEMKLKNSNSKQALI